MDTAKAVELINDIHLMPGWSLSAVSAYPMPGTVQVTCTIETVNSNQDMSKRGYPHHITITPGILFPVSDYPDAERLEYEVLSWVLSLMEHELREFFRVGADRVAPFHPHRQDGDAAYQRQAMGLLDGILANISN